MKELGRKEHNGVDSSSVSTGKIYLGIKCQSGSGSDLHLRCYILDGKRDVMLPVTT